LEVRTDDERNTTMADERMSLLELLRKAGADGGTDFLRTAVQVLAEALMDAEATELTELTGERTGEPSQVWPSHSASGSSHSAAPRPRDPAAPRSPSLP
jgi:hypothetical protein